MSMFLRITPNENGTHDDASYNEKPPVLDESWAIVPHELEQLTLSLLPWISIVVQDGVVVSATENTEAKAAWEALPQPTPQPTPEQDRDAMLIDLEYRMTLLELGV